jgi:hypothetical protein
MSIDERLEAPAVRHGALAQSIKVLAQMQKETELEIKRLGLFVRLIVVTRGAR